MTKRTDQVVVEWDDWTIRSDALAHIVKLYAEEFVVENYIKTHPINAPSKEFILRKKQEGETAVLPAADTHEQKPQVTQEEEPTNNIINITSFTLKETELGLTIVFTTDTGKTLVARYGGTKGQTTTITTTTTTVIQ